MDVQSVTADFLASIRGKARASHTLGQRFVELGQPFPAPEAELGLGHREDMPGRRDGEATDAAV